MVPPASYVPPLFLIQQQYLGQFCQLYCLVLTFLSDLMKWPSHEGQQKLVKLKLIDLLWFSNL